MGPHQILRTSLLAVEEMRLWGLAGAKGISYLAALSIEGTQRWLFLLVVVVLCVVTWAI